MSTSRVARTLLGTISLVTIGAVLGIAADRTLHAPGARNILADHTAALVDHAAELRESLHESALSDFEEHLHLDENQRRSIDSLFRRHQGSVDEAWETLRPQVESAVDSVHMHIESILRPDQREAFREWLASGADGVMDAGHLPDSRR